MVVVCRMGHTVCNLFILSVEKKNEDEGYEDFQIFFTGAIPTISNNFSGAILTFFFVSFRVQKIWLEKPC